MDYRHDLLRWRHKQIGLSIRALHRALNKESGVSLMTLCDTLRGATNPTATTIKSVSKALDLDPKFVMDFRLRKSDFHCAVVANGAAR